MKRFLALTSLVALSACQSPRASSPSPTDLAPVRSAKPPIPAPPDLANRRIGNREALRLTTVVVVHADKHSRQPDGRIQITGNVFLDGSRQTDANDLVWPRYAYADVAIWDSTTETLTLSGNAIVEGWGPGGDAIVKSTSLGTKIRLSPHQLRTEGPHSTFVSVTL